MTDGIIQKIFEKHLREYIELPEYDLGILHRKIITRIEQELIAEIEKICDNETKFPYSQNTIRRLLIGDN